MNEFQFKIINKWVAQQKILDYAEHELGESVIITFTNDAVEKLNINLPMGSNWFEIHTFDQFKVIKRSWELFNPTEDISWFDPLVERLNT